jgi:hypothetical protein
MESKNASAGVLTRLKGIGEAGQGMVSEDREAVSAESVNDELGELRKAQDAAGGEGELTVIEESDQGAGMSNKKRREARSIVNKAVHKLPGGEDELFDRVASGERISSIIAQLRVSEGAFYAWTETTPERAEQFSRARARAAHALAEQGLEIVDSATVVEANLANVRARYRQWLASKWNQQTYGDNKNQVTVQLSINTAHLQANRVNAVNDHSNVIDVAPHNG